MDQSSSGVKHSKEGWLQVILRSVNLEMYGSFTSKRSIFVVYAIWCAEDDRPTSTEIILICDILVLIHKS